MSLLTQLRAKQRREAEEAAQRRAARIARKVARAAEKSRADGLNDLPLEVAVAMEQNPVPPDKPEPATVDDSVEGLVARLTKIREKIWRLQAMFAVTLSQEIAIEANRYLHL